MAQEVTSQLMHFMSVTYSVPGAYLKQLWPLVLYLQISERPESRNVLLQEIEKVVCNLAAIAPVPKGVIDSICNNESIWSQNNQGRMNITHFKTLWYDKYGFKRTDVR